MSTKSSSLMESNSEVGALKDVAVVRKDFLQNGSSFVRTVTVLSLLVLAQATWACWVSATHDLTIDFFTFWSVPQLFHDEAIGNIYSFETQREMGSKALLQAKYPGTSEVQREATTAVLQVYNGRIHETGSPLLYALVGALSSGDYPTDKERFLFVCLACLAASIVLLKSLLRFTTIEAVLLSVFILWNFGPFVSDINVGNVNEFQLFAIVLFIFFTARSKPLLAGLTIGAATAFKPTTLMVLALCVIAELADREYEELLYMLLGCFAAFASSVLAAGIYFHKPAMWLEFLHSLPATLNGTYALEIGNFSLSALIPGTARVQSVAIPIVLLAVFSWLFFSTRRGKQSSGLLPKEMIDNLRMDKAFCVGGCGCAVMLLSSPLVWSHYYLLLLPLCLYLVFTEACDAVPVRDNTRRILSVSLPFVPLVVFSLSFVQFITYTPLLCVLIISATILTIALASYRVWERRRLFQLPISIS